MWGILGKRDGVVGWKTYDLLNDFGGGEDIDDTLVDAHLEAVPGVGTLSAGRLTGGDLENLGGHAGGSLDLNTLILGSTDEIGADCRLKSIQ